MSTHWPSSVLSEVCTGTIENSPSPIPGIWSPWPVNDTIPLLCDSSGKLPAWKGQWVFNEWTKQNKTKQSCNLTPYCFCGCSLLLKPQSKTLFFWFIFHHGFTSLTVRYQWTLEYTLVLRFLCMLFIWRIFTVIKYAAIFLTSKWNRHIYKHVSIIWNVFYFSSHTPWVVLNAT